MSTSIFPSQNTWITPRTELGQLDTSNCKIILNQKIENISKVLVNATSDKFYFKLTLVGNDSFHVPFYDIYSDKACTHKIFDVVDISKYVVEEAKYYTLNNISVWQGALPSEGKLYLVNTWYYAHNANEIILPNNRFGVSQYTPDLIMVWCLFDLLGKYSTIYMKLYDDGSDPLMFDSKDILSQYNVQASTESLTKWQFRIYYTPLGESVKLQVPKTNPQVNQFCIPYSQQQPIVDNVTLGREMQSIANRAGCETKEVVRTLTSITQKRKLGTIWRERDASGKFTGNVWRLTGESIEIYSETFIRVTETWSKNWAYRSENVPINREFRSWNIPADTVQRNLLWQDYCLITRKTITDWNDNSLLSDIAKLTFMQGLDGTYSSNYKTNECNIMWFYQKDEDNNIHGAVLSCSAFGFGNSLVFSGKTKDNLSAGVQRVDSESDGRYQFCKDVYYCNEDGTLDNMYIQIGSALRSDDDNLASYVYPECYVDYADKGSANMFEEDGAVCLFKNKSFTVLKDPCEQLNFTYQLHLLTADGLLVIGSTWAASNPLVKQRDETQTIKVWKLTTPLPQGAQVMTTTYGTLQQNSDLFSVNTDSGSPSITFNPAGGNDGVGVCVTDENNAVLIAFNSPDPATFYVKFTHNYNAIAQALTN